FAIAAAYAPGGRAIFVLPSAHRTAEGLRSRIVAELPAGTVITVPRGFVDHVVTEHGIRHAARQDGARANRRAGRRRTPGLPRRAACGGPPAPPSLRRKNRHGVRGHPVRDPRRRRVD